MVVANFTNPGGLIDSGGNLFESGPNAGPAVIANPGTLGSGLIVAGALEMSNVDLGEEFTQMILTSTGYSASSRVIRTADELIQQLLVLGRQLLEDRSHVGARAVLDTLLAIAGAASCVWVSLNADLIMNSLPTAGAPQSARMFAYIHENLTSAVAV